MPALLPDLDRLLDHLAKSGYGIGVRERLAAHRLVLAATVSGTSSDDPTERFSILEPLLSRNHEEQRRFIPLVRDFLRDGHRRPSHGLAPDGPNAGQLTGQRRYRTYPAVAAVIAAAIATLWWFIQSPIPPSAPPQEAGSSGQAEAVKPAASPPPLASSIYIPRGSFPEPPPPATGGGTSLAMLRSALVAVELLIVALLGAFVIRQLRLDMYLQRVTTDQELERHVLRAEPADPTSILGDARLRPVSRVLRQRMTGARRAFDPRETLRATVRAGGALVARYRHVRQTPEYLVLIDRLSTHDHQAQLHELLFTRLKQRGVGIDLFNFEASPAAGCSRLQQIASDNENDGTHHPLSVASLSNRYGGHRLLVVGDTSAAFDPVSGSPAGWTSYLGPFPQRVWLTPIPFASWGAAELGVHGLGFLLVPAWPDALETVADWLASDRATPWNDAETSTAFPPTLRGEGLIWTARQRRPPQAVEEDLLFELRNYLNPSGFQWLCACAVFPGISWPLTLALGKVVLPAEVRRSGREIGRRLATLSALPWFRYGRMPDWLRESLVDRLDPDQQPGVRRLIEHRLGDALNRTSGALLTEVAVRRWLRALFSRRARRVAQDAVLAGFLEPEVAPKLAQRLPDPLRRVLFRNGRPMFGVRRGVLTAAVLLVLGIGVAVLPRPWARLTARQPGATDVVPVEPTPFTALSGHKGQIVSAEFSRDGRRIVTASDDGTVRVWTAAGTPGGTIRRDGVAWASFIDGDVLIGSSSGPTQRWHADGSATTLADSRRIAIGAGGERRFDISDRGDIRARDVRDTSRTIGALQPGETDIAASPDGSHVVTNSLNGTPRVLSSAGGEAPLVLQQGAAVYRASFSPDGTRILTASADRTARLWDAATGQRLFTFSGHESQVVDASFSADGQQIVTASFDGTARVWRIDGAPVAVLRQAGVRRVSISPDGQRVVAGGLNGVVQLWGRPLDATVDLVSCDRTVESVAATRRLADAIAADSSTSFLPIVYPDATWGAASKRQGPDFRQVWYDRSNQGNAASVARLVGHLQGTWQVVGIESVPAAATVGLCDRRSPLPPRASASSVPPSDTTVRPPLPTLSPPTEPPPARVTTPAPAGTSPGDAKVPLPETSRPFLTIASGLNSGLRSDRAFADVIVRALAGGADRDQNGVVDSDELAVYVRQRVSRLTGAQLQMVPGGAPSFNVTGNSGSHALVVGVDRYIDPSLRPLSTTSANVQAITRMLVAEGSTVTSLLGDRASRSLILRALQSLRARVKPGSLCIVYLAGYGMNYEDTGLALLPYDAKAGYSPSWIAADEVQRAMNATSAGAKLLLLDLVAAGKATVR